MDGLNLQLFANAFLNNLDCPVTSFLKYTFILLLIVSGSSDIFAQPLILPGAQTSPQPLQVSPQQEPSASKPKKSRHSLAYLKTFHEEKLLDKTLKLNGTTGALKLERSAAGWMMEATFEGFMISRPQDSCAVKLNDGKAISLISQGKPDGLIRYQLEAPACPITFDILDKAVLVKYERPFCTFSQADCQVDARGLWGDESAVLIPQASSFEKTRGQGDKIVRDGFRELTEKGMPQDARLIAMEQAAFSAERETICRNYARENAHGYCHALYTQARVASLQARLQKLAKPGTKEARQ